MNEQPIVTTYQCTECGSKDHDWGNCGIAPAALICYQCRAGAGISVADQVQKQFGMIPIHATENA